MEYVLASGKTITDEELEREAEMWENDTWEGHLTNIRIGRPPLCDEELGTVTFKAPKSSIAAMERKAASQGMTKSQFLRAAMEQAIA